MRLSASEVDWSKLSERARWALEEIMPLLLEAYSFDEIAVKLQVDRADVVEAHELLEAESQALAGRIILPELSEEEYDSLKASIEEFGQVYPVLLGADGVTVDGRHRLRICRELNLDPDVRVLALPADQLQSLALAVNVARRQLTAGARRGIARAELLRDPTRSDRAIAVAAGVSHPTIATIRGELEQAGTVESSSTRTGRDGVPQPVARKPSARPEPTSRTIRVKVAEQDFDQLVGRWVDCHAFRLIETRPNVYELQVQLQERTPASPEQLKEVELLARNLDGFRGQAHTATLDELLANASEIFGRKIARPEDLERAEADWCRERLLKLATAFTSRA